MEVTQLLGSRIERVKILQLSIYMMTTENKYGKYCQGNNFSGNLIIDFVHNTSEFLPVYV